MSYPPGAQDVVHRHDAHAFVYVLEGRIIMQLKDQPAVTLEAGGPTDVHVVGGTASNTEPARFVVVLLKGKGAPILRPCLILYGPSPSGQCRLWGNLVGITPAGTRR